MEKATLTVDVAPELRRRIRVAAAVRDESLKEWIERALLRELEEEAGDGSTFRSAWRYETTTRPRSLSPAGERGDAHGRRAMEPVLERTDRGAGRVPMTAGEGGRLEFPLSFDRVAAWASKNRLPISEAR